MDVQTTMVVLTFLFLFTTTMMCSIFEHKLSLPFENKNHQKLYILHTSFLGHMKNVNLLFPFLLCFFYCGLLLLTLLS